MKRVAVFASGSGSNAQNLIQYFNHDHPHKEVRISLIVANRPDAYVLERARLLHTPALVFTRETFYPQILPKEAVAGDLVHRNPESLTLKDPAPSYPLLESLSACQIDYIVLAGFLWLIPQYLIDAYPGRIVNIHPALLPRFGGKGMYGMHVHRAVVASGVVESGITVHLVDNQYDHGNILFQARCRVEVGDTPESLAHKIHLLEQEHFPKVVEVYINDTQYDYSGT